VQAAIDFDGIVVKVRQVVVIEINGDRTAVPVLPWRIVRAVDGMRAVRVAIRLDVDAIVEVGDVVVGDDVAPDRTTEPPYRTRGPAGRSARRRR
jgi:hypothetical protein